MIKRIIENEIGERLEVIVVSGLVGLSAEIGFSSYEFLFDNDEDIHCFISELQSAMLRAKEEPKEEESKDNEDDMELVYDFPSNKSAWTIGEIADMVVESAKEKLKAELCNCGKIMGADRCTRLGCDNFNAFGSGTVDTTSNGTE